jgi:archaemetzincin
MGRIIYLQKIGTIKQEILLELRGNIEKTFSDFHIILKINPGELLPQGTEYSLEREQYDAVKILKKMVRSTQTVKSFGMLGVIDEDIYKKKSNFVFGLANKTSRNALISLTRLRESFYKDRRGVYRQVESEDIFYQRISKEAIHELGHIFGLPHCKNNCIMRFSNSLLDTDNKPKEFCESCFRNLGDFFYKSEQKS